MTDVNTRTRWGFLSRLCNTLRNERGSIDLGSVMVGVLVVGIVSGTALTTTSTLVPWMQDSTAAATFTAVRVAESADHMKNGAYAGYDSLVNDNLLPRESTVAVATDEGGTCYVAVALSASGATFVTTSKSEVVTRSSLAVNTDWCTPLAPILDKVVPR